MSRRLSPREAALWHRLAGTITPLPGKRRGQPRSAAPEAEAPQPAPPAPKVKGRIPPPLPPAAPPPRPAPKPVGATLDSTWDRRIARGEIHPDFTLDLHGATLDAAHARLDHGLAQALAQGARVVLLVTGRPRPHDDHSQRGERRGAIRAKFADWLAAGPHASRIAAIRAAHPRHGGAGAVYIVLRRPR